jgi:hypothetical protein
MNDAPDDESAHRVLERIGYALVATVVASAAVIVILASIKASILYDVWLSHQTVARIYIAIPTVLFPLCILSAPALRRGFPILRSRKK